MLPQAQGSSGTQAAAACGGGKAPGCGAAAARYLESKTARTLALVQKPPDPQSPHTWVPPRHKDLCVAGGRVAGGSHWCSPMHSKLSAAWSLIYLTLKRAHSGEAGGGGGVNRTIPLLQLRLLRP